MSSTVQAIEVAYTFDPPVVVVQHEGSRVVRLSADTAQVSRWPASWRSGVYWRVTFEGRSFRQIGATQPLGRRESCGWTIDGPRDSAVPPPQIARALVETTRRHLAAGAPWST